MSSFLSAAIGRLAASAAAAVARAYGTTANATLAPTPAQRLVRQLFFQPTGAELLRQQLLSSLPPWIISEGIPTDAAIEGVQSLDRLLEDFHPDSTAIRALADPSRLFDELSKFEPPFPASTGALEVFRYALREVIAHLRSMAPASDRLIGPMLVNLIEQTSAFRLVVDNANDRTAAGHAELMASLSEVQRIVMQMQMGQTRSQHRATEGLDHKAVVSAISEPRMAPYLRSMNGDAVGAIRLYTWNLDVSAEILRGIQIVEVALRNSIDRQLRFYNSGQNGTEQWITAPCSLIQAVMSRNTNPAIKRAARSHANSRGWEPTPQNLTRAKAKLTHDDLVAHTPFATWRYALPHSRNASEQRKLWRECLHRAFPEQDVNNYIVLAQHVANLHETRNRIAHMEPILSRTRNRAHYHAMRYILDAIDPNMTLYFLSSGQQFSSILGEKPMPGKI